MAACFAVCFRLIDDAVCRIIVRISDRRKTGDDHFRRFRPRKRTAVPLSKFFYQKR